MSTYSLKRTVEEWQAIADQLEAMGDRGAMETVDRALQQTVAGGPNWAIEIGSLAQTRYDAILQAEAAIRGRTEKK
jgi:hypothetical protein